MIDPNLPTICKSNCILTYFQDLWLQSATESLFDNSIIENISNTPALAQEIDASLPYSQFMCSTSSNGCFYRLAMGQNLMDMILKLKIQGKTVEGNVYANSEATFPEESGTSICTSISAAEEGYKSLSGVQNGVETIIDLQTFDNGDLAITGDGAYVQVTEPKDYPLAQLKGFSVGPGSAVDVHIRPALFRITESALHRFDYLQRRCADTSVDKGLEDLDGMDGDNSYSLSNCLVSAAVTEMDNK